VWKNPSKAVNDSHTPQLMKLQLLFAPILLPAVAYDLIAHPVMPASPWVLAAFALSTLPFALRVVAKDPLLGLLSPVLLAARACAQGLGVIAGAIGTRRNPVRAPARLHV